MMNCQVHADFPDPRKEQHYGNLLWIKEIGLGGFDQLKVKIKETFKEDHQMRNGTSRLQSGQQDDHVGMEQKVEWQEMQHREKEKNNKKEWDWGKVGEKYQEKTWT